MTLQEWEIRNNVMLVALNSDGKIVAAGWHNLDNNPNKEEKAEVKRFYRDSAGYEIRALRGQSKEKFKAMEWA